MSSVATAVIGSAVIGGYSANKAAKTAAKSADKGLAQSTALADQSRTNATNLYNQARVAGQRGLTSAFDYYKTAAQSKYQPFIRANTAAQGIIGQGAQQANNAILGLPVNMSFTQPQQVKPDMSFLNNAQLPQMAGEYLPDQQVAQPQQIQNPTAGMNEEQSRQYYGLQQQMLGLTRGLM
jgi:hypothetical protein